MGIYTTLGYLEYGLPTTEEENYHAQALNSEHIWLMHFDGAKSKCEAGVGVVLQALNGVTHTFSYKLNFSCTNNVVEYEALTLGLIKAIKMKVGTLQVKGDSKLIINQVKDLFSVNHPQLKNYRDRIWMLLEHFQAFSIGYIPREDNQLADSLVVTTSLIEIGASNPLSGFPIEIVTRPAVQDNIDHWQIFLDND